MTTLSATQSAVETLKASLETLVNGLSGRKAEITKAFNEAKTAADQAHKEALKLATDTQKEALKQFESEESEIAKLEAAIKALGGSTKKVKAKETAAGDTKVKGFVVPASLAEAKTQKQKVYFAISELGEATKEQIVEKLASYGSDIKDIDTLVWQLGDVVENVSTDKRKGKYKVK